MAAGVDADSAAALLSESRELLHKDRAKRPRPHLDDKVRRSQQGAAVPFFKTGQQATQGCPSKLLCIIQQPFVKPEAAEFYVMSGLPF